jgi:hypothetical protein
MSELDEVADAMYYRFSLQYPAGATFVDCVAYVRQRMPNESETVLDGVAFALYARQPHKGVTPRPAEE